MRFRLGNLLRYRTENVISTVALAVSAFSLLISSFGIYIAHRAQTYTESLDSSRRSIVLIGDTGDQQESLRVEPLQPAMKFLSGYAYFPNEIIDRAVSIDAQGTVRWMGSIINGIQDHVSASTPVLDGHVSIVEGGIPVVIYSYYAFEGQVYKDYSLYSATFLAQVGSQEDGGTRAQLTGLIYGRRINSMSEDGAETLSDELWNSMKKQKFGLPELPQ